MIDPHSETNMKLSRWNRDMIRLTQTSTTSNIINSFKVSNDIFVLLQKEEIHGLINMEWYFIVLKCNKGNVLNIWATLFQVKLAVNIWF